MKAALGPSPSVFLSLCVCVCVTAFMCLWANMSVFLSCSYIVIIPLCLKGISLTKKRFSKHKNFTTLNPKEARLHLTHTCTRPLRFTASEMTEIG